MLRKFNFLVSESHTTLESLKNPFAEDHDENDDEKKADHQNNSKRNRAAAGGGA